ncbi:MAG: hypothetical protein KDD35_05750, partial [Bdellovibrionales bacterium]|nr:hypothetical protein [Bdellovibrionales bacterium]
FLRRCDMGESLNSNGAEKARSLQDAMEVIKEAIKGSGSEVRSILERDYQSFRESLAKAKPEIQGALKDLGETTKENLQQVKASIETKGKEAAHYIDESAHKKPWIFIGVTAALFAVIGFLCGRKSNR